MPSARQLADRFHRDWLAAHPFTATLFGVTDFDDRVPDDSEAGDEARRRRLEGHLEEAAALGASVSGDDAVTLACVAEVAEQELAGLDSAAIEHTVTPMPYAGPAVLLVTCARMVLADATAADAYLERLGAAGGWIDQQSERLRAGAAKGRLPVSPLLEAAVEWIDGVLAADAPAALLAPSAPDGWSGAAAWETARRAAATDVVAPALRRWRAVLQELAPAARPASAAGLVHLPGGEADYARAIRVNTTLPLSAAQLHRTGLDEVERLEARCLELGATIGLDDLASVHHAMRMAASETAPEAAMAAAVDAVRRAERRAGEVFPQPLPQPCEVSPMPPIVAGSGAAPHYSPPRLDGTRPGTYWFNTELPTAGTGWDLEAVAFHEAVPGHHLQMSRIQQLAGLPPIQSQMFLTVFGEGWGLYAEQLAEEMGLYSSTEALLGSMAAGLMRACRLVVDTGLHALGWGRDEALAYFVAHVPVPEAFLANEIDRYIAWPGQALAYLTGKLEILRLRDEARTAMGERFELPAFHAAVLDHGSLPMPLLESVLRAWAA